MKKKLLSLILMLSFVVVPISAIDNQEPTPEQINNNPEQNQEFERLKELIFTRNNMIIAGYSIAGLAAKSLLPSYAVTMGMISVACPTLVDYITESATAYHLQGISAVVPKIVKKCVIDNTYEFLYNKVSLPCPQWIKNSKVCKCVGDFTAKVSLSMTYDAAKRSLQTSIVNTYAQLKNRINGNK